MASLAIYIPFTRTHQIVVQLLVQVVQQALRLHDHRVNLVGRELELVARQRVGQAERHRGHLLLRQTGQQRLGLRPDATHQLLHAAVGHALDGQLRLDGGAQFGVGDAQLLLHVLVHQALERLLQRLAQLALDEGGGGGERICGILELLEVLQLDAAEQNMAN